MVAAVAEDYRRVIAEAAAAGEREGRRNETLARLRRELRRRRVRDHLPVPERELALQAVERLAQRIEPAVARRP